MSEILERAARDLIARPPLPGPVASELRDRLSHRRRRRSRGIIAVGCLVAVAGVVIARGRPGDDGVGQPAAPVTTSAAPSMSAPVATDVVAGLTCDDDGCDGFDRLPVEAGVSDFYVGAESLGEPVLDLGQFDALTRCTALTADSMRCAQLEGIAGVGLATYTSDVVPPEDTTDRISLSFTIHIGTTFTEIAPADYATQWGRQDNQAAATTVRDHPAVSYLSDAGPALVWQERPGVLVWVTVPPEIADQLASIAAGVRRTPGPATILWRVVVPGTGRPYDAGSNDGDGLLVGRVGGLECVGYGYINTCGQDIADLTFVDGTDLSDIGLSGWVPYNVVYVEFSWPDGNLVGIDTQPLGTFTGRFFSGRAQSDPGLTRSTPTQVQWFDAAHKVVHESSAAVTDPTALTGISWPQPWYAISTLKAPALVDPPATVAPGVTVADDAPRTQQMFADYLPAALDSLGFVANGDALIDPQTGVGNVSATRAADGVTLVLTVTPGTPLVPEDHSRVPLTIVDQTELSFTGRIASNSGWSFDLTVTAPDTNTTIPTIEALQQMLYTLDP